MKKSDIYGSGNWIKAADGKLSILDNPKSATLTISRHMTISEFKDAESGAIKSQRTIYFDELGGEDGPGLSLNPTNWSMVAALTGLDDDDKWPGQKIELYVTKTEFRGKVVDCVRIREPTVRAAAPAATAQAEPMGEAWATKAYEKLAEMGKTHDDLRAALRRLGHPAPESGDIETWPKSLATYIKHCLDRKCEVEVDEIPF